METIMVGVDGSEPSLIAVDWTADHVAGRPSRVELVRVDSPVVIPEGTEELAFAAAEARLLDVAPDAEVEDTRVPGRMPDALLEAASRADLLVIGAHRHRPLRTALTGWLPLRVASRAKTPIVVVPDDWNRGDGPVVVGVDDDASSAAALEFAARAAVATEADLLAVHAWQMPTPEMSGSVAILASPIEERARHQLVLEEACKAVSQAYPDLRIRKSLTRDSPVAALMAAADDASLLVIGTHHRGIVAGGFFGSVGQDLLAESSIPVCIVPLPATEE